jgi:acetyltransferase-like isoleucine patch superfamily enzyme
MIEFLLYTFGGWLARTFRLKGVEIPKSTKTCLFSSAYNLSPKTSSITVGEHGEMLGQLSVDPNASIKIGDYVEIQMHTVIQAMEKIEIGNYCKIASDVFIQDNNSHSTDPDDRREELIDHMKNGTPLNRKNVGHAPIIIEDDVFIGRRAMIYKGVHIGQGAVIAAGAVVTKDIPPYSLAAGNPAQVVKTYKKNSSKDN